MPTRTSSSETIHLRIDHNKILNSYQWWSEDRNHLVRLFHTMGTFSHPLLRLSRSRTWEGVMYAKCLALSEYSRAQRQQRSLTIKPPGMIKNTIGDNLKTLSNKLRQHYKSTSNSYRRPMKKTNHNDSFPYFPKTTKNLLQFIFINKK